MKFKRLFYDSTVNFNNISRQRLVLAILIGLVSALTIYSFYYVLRETFRVMSVGFDNLPNILSEADRNFYNLFFAGLSLIFGNSITINFLFSKPQRILSKFNPTRKRILNDQIFLSFNFMYWFAKIGLVFGVFSMCCMDFNFLPYFTIPAIILLFVLYLESWKSLSTVFRKKRLKYQVLHLLIILILTFGISQIDIINYKKIDENALKANPIIDLPYSTFYNNKKNSWPNRAINFKLIINEMNELIIIAEDRRKISLEHIAQEIINKRASMREEFISFLKVKISADKNIPLIYIRRFEAELLSVNQSRIIYNVYNDDLYARRFESRGLKKIITPFVLKFKQNSVLPLTDYETEYHPIIDDTLKIKIGKEIIVSNLVVPNNMLIIKFKNHINKNTVFEYIYNKDTKYQDYITVLSAHFKAIDLIRKKNQKVELISQDFKYINVDEVREEESRLREEYPTAIIEKFN